MKKSDRENIIRNEEVERRLRVLADFTIDRILSLTPKESKRIDREVKKGTSTLK
jgi:hypothetical protein